MKTTWFLIVLLFLGFVLHNQQMVILQLKVSRLQEQVITLEGALTEEPQGIETKDFPDAMSQKGAWL